MTGKPEYLFDQRVVTRNIKRERITRKEYEQYLKSLDDVTAKAVPMFHDDPPSDEEEDE